MQDNDDDATKLLGDPDEAATRLTSGAATAAAPTATDMDGTVAGGAPTAAAAAAAPPVLINNRFELVKILGQGGMGSVHKALDRRKKEANDRDPYVAVKLLNPEFAAHPESLIALQREARKSQTLAHPNIVTVYDFDRQGDQVYMTMEFLQGKPLDVFIATEAKDKALGRDRVLQILRDTCAGLAYAHEHGIAHSDLKPGNIFVGERVTKLLDFGIARAVSSTTNDDEDGEKTYFDPADLGALTPTYASVEMLEGEKPEISDDIYAIGLIAYELFTGRHPFDKKRANVAEAEGLKPARIKELKRKEWRALEKALAFRRDKRTHDVREFIAAFESRTPAVVLGLFGVLVIAGLSTVVGVQQVQQPQVDTEALRQDVEIELKQGLARDDLESLLSAPAFNEDWSSALQTQLVAYRELAPGDSPWVQDFGDRLVAAYMQAARNRFGNDELEASERLLMAAEEWQARFAEWEPAPPIADENADLSGVAESLESVDTDGEDTVYMEQAARLQGELAARRQKLAQERRALEAEVARRVEQEKQRLAAEQAAADARRAQERREADARRRSRERQQKISALKTSLENHKACSESADFAAASAQLSALSGLDKGAAAALSGSLGSAWASCAHRLSVQGTRSAESYLAAAIQTLPQDKSLAAVNIDPCADLSPGTGARGRGHSCYDRTPAGRAPELVVISGLNGAPVAMGKYEVSRSDFGRYCKDSGACDAAAFAGNLPVTGISLAQAEAFLDWLSKRTGFLYRLPSHKEWLHAASGGGSTESPNRNCTLSALGIRRGLRLISSRTGKASGWGLVNSVGNAGEMATRGSAVIVAGGRHTDAQERCLMTTESDWNAAADATVGFRVLREMPAI